MTENRSEQSRYLNADESRLVNEYAAEYLESPPDFADKVLDDLDGLIMKSEGLPTLETTNALAHVRRMEAEQQVERMGRGAISGKALQSIQADDAMASLDDCLWQNVREQSPLSEDGGWGHLDKVVEEVQAGHKARQKDEARAAKERQATARRFMGTGFSQERSITAAEFERGRRR